MQGDSIIVKLHLDTYPSDRKNCEYEKSCYGVEDIVPHTFVKEGNISESAFWITYQSLFIVSVIEAFP